MPTATATQSGLNRVIKGQYRGYVAKVLKQGPTGHYQCELRNLENDREVTDWVSAAELQELPTFAPGTICRIEGGEFDGLFAQVLEHNPEHPLYQGSAHCSVIYSRGKQRNNWVKDEHLRPARSINLRSGEYSALASTTVEGLLLDVQYDGHSFLHQTGKFCKNKNEAQALLEEFIQSRSSVTSQEETSPLEEGMLEPVAEDVPTEEKPLDATPDLESKTSNVIQFRSRNSVTEEEAVPLETENPPEAASGETGSETEEEDWIYLSLEAEKRVDAIASQLVEITEPFVKSVTDFLWELKFVVYEDDHRRKSREFGTFEQLCRHLYEERNFPYHPNTAREKANAEQERRLLRQAGVEVEVEKMSDSAALELRKVDALKAEPDVILEKKREVIENADGLTKKAIASSIKSLSEADDWENEYKFRYPAPKKRDSGEPVEKISRQEIEEIQSRNARLRKENETLQYQLAQTQEKLAEKVQNEIFLSGMVKTAQEQLDEKERELEQLRQELEEMRSLAKKVG